MRSLLIIGKIPPPIGGVTIHVQRLLDHLERDGFSYSHFDLNPFSVRRLCSAMRAHSICHIHTSRPLFRLFACLLARVLGKHSILTIHGNLGRFGFWNNLLDRLSIQCCRTPIVLNSDSLQQALKLNHHARLISAFLPPIKSQALATGLAENLKFFCDSFEVTYCTNAFNLNYDQDGQDIYSIVPLVQAISKAPQVGLVFSDPSGNYQALLKSAGLSPKNLFCITEPHDFVEVIQQTDGLIRATTTDGDSLSVREGLHYGKRVICTDCVSRPAGVITFPSGDWEAMLDVTLSPESVRPSHEPVDSFAALVAVYNECLKK